MAFIISKIVQEELAPYMPSPPPSTPPPPPSHTHTHWSVILRIKGIVVSCTHLSARVLRCVSIRACVRWSVLWFDHWCVRWCVRRSIRQSVHRSLHNAIVNGSQHFHLRRYLIYHIAPKRKTVRHCGWSQLKERFP